MHHNDESDENDDTTGTDSMAYNGNGIPMIDGA